MKNYKMKSYNPLKMWGSWIKNHWDEALLIIGAIIGLIFFLRGAGIIKGELINW